MYTLRRIVVCLLLLLIGTACSITRNIPDGQYILHRVRIENDKETPRKARIPNEELAKFIRQSPNKRFLGTNLYVWLYESADTAKHNKWNNWKRRMGEAPVLLDEQLTRRSADNLKIYMDSKGYFSSSSSYEIDTLSRPKRAIVTYRTTQRTPYLLSNISYEFRDKQLETLILADSVNTLLRTGERFDVTVLDAERERITLYLKEQGYYNFTIGNIEYEADTLVEPYRVGLKMIVKPRLRGYNTAGEPLY